MEPYLPFPHDRLHHVVLQFVIFIGYFIFMSTILDFNVFESEDERLPSECKKICHVSLPHRLTSADNVDFFSSPNKTHAVFLKFRRKDFSRLQIQQNDQEILDPVNLVWVDSIKAPFLSFDLGFNVYSFTTLWHNIRHATVVVDSESSKCLQNTSYSCVTKSLATEFLTNVSQSGQSRGTLCYVVNDTQTVTVNYNCCQRNSKTHKIECNIPASTGRKMFGVFYTTVAVATIVFVCFPAILCYFPDDKESSQTVKHNTQVHNPLFCLVNYMVQSLRHYSAKYYIVNMTRKLLIGLSLPVLFYIDWGLAFYTAKYDIPKLFNDKVTTYWLKNKHTGVMFGSRKAIAVYSIVVLLISILPQVNPETVDRDLNLYKKGVADLEVQWKKPFNLNRKIFLKFSSGFIGLLDDGTSLCKKIGKFVFSCFLTLIIFPVIFVLVFIGYGWYVSPLGRQISILLCHAHIYVEWFKQYLKKSKALKRCTEKLSQPKKDMYCCCLGTCMFCIYQCINSNHHGSVNNSLSLSVVNFKTYSLSLLGDNGKQRSLFTPNCFIFPFCVAHMEVPKLSWKYLHRASCTDI